MGDKAEPRKRAVHCPTCRRFMFNIRVTMTDPRVGTFAEITDYRCSKCGKVNLVLLGIADADRRDDREKVEEKLRQQMEEQNE